jgi:hypothetical protein
MASSFEILCCTPILLFLCRLYAMLKPAKQNYLHTIKSICTVTFETNYTSSCIYQLLHIHQLKVPENFNGNELQTDYFFWGGS